MMKRVNGVEDEPIACEMCQVWEGMGKGFFDFLGSRGYQFVIVQSMFR